jgi:hypothetical protein
LVGDGNIRRQRGDKGYEAGRKRTGGVSGASVAERGRGVKGGSLSRVRILLGSSERGMGRALR